MSNFLILIIMVIAVWLVIHALISVLFSISSIDKGYSGIASFFLSFCFGIVGWIYTCSQPHKSSFDIETRKSKRNIIIILAVISCLVAVVPLSVGAYFGNSAFEALSESAKNIGGENTGKILEEYLKVDQGISEYHAESDLEFASFSKLVTFTNISDEAHSYSVTLKASNGDTENVYITLQPGESSTETVFERFGEEADSMSEASITVDNVSMY